ncbi:MAG: hypothetical protein DLM64_04540 [Solirubrobacterales bacterium]|nr:MAG: hypothetical protein DLM64_04540 [Solirubrobacterales bacterium]
MTSIDSRCSTSTADVLAHNVGAFAADEASAHASDNQTALAAIFELGTLLVTAGGFLVWFYRAYSNLPLLGVKHMRYRTPWAVGAWFIPVLSIFQPKQMANDIWRGSHPEDPFHEPDWTLPSHHCSITGGLRSCCQALSTRLAGGGCGTQATRLHRCVERRTSISPRGESRSSPPCSLRRSFIGSRSAKSRGHWFG